MADSYYDYLYGNVKKDAVEPKQDKPTEDSMPQSTIVQDEAIGKPWTHRFTIYCANPSKEFIDGLKKGECVVAVYEKAKETAEPEKEEKAPSNEQ